MARPIRNTLRKPVASTVVAEHAGGVTGHSAELAAPDDAPDAGGGERRRSERTRPVLRKKYVPQIENKASHLWTVVFCLAVAAGITYGARQTIEWELTPKDGLGYYLGIAGALMMLGLALYPLRKHSKTLSSWGTVAGWFRAHMILEIVGPALVIVHSGFELNSKNGSVAMIAMLLVVVSGIFGRYIYARLHAGLYGRRTDVAELIKNIEQTEAKLAINSAIPIQTITDLKQLADVALAATRTPKGCVEFRAGRGDRRKLKRTTHTEIETTITVAALKCRADPEMLRIELDKAHEAVDHYFLMVEQIGTVRLYERVFHYWHYLHMPFFFLLVATAILHVIAVHLY